MQAAQARFQAAFEHAPIGMALVRGDDGSIIEANDALVRDDRPPEESSAGAGSTRSTTRGARGAAPEVRLAATGALAISTTRRASCTARATSWTPRCGRRWSAGGTRATSILQVLDVSDRKRFEGQLRRLADHDALTGLYNRRRFATSSTGSSATPAATERRRGAGPRHRPLPVHQRQLRPRDRRRAARQVAALLRSRLRETDIIGRARRRRVRRDPPADPAADAERSRGAGRGRPRSRSIRPRRAQGPGDPSIGIRAIDPAPELTPESCSPRPRSRATWPRSAAVTAARSPAHGSASRALAGAELGRADPRRARARRLRPLRAADPRPRAATRRPLGAADPAARRGRRDHPARRVPGRRRALRPDQGDRSLGDRRARSG